MVTERKKVIGWNDLDYLNDLIKKATPEHDSPMIVDWVPHVRELLREVEYLRSEYEYLLEDYKDLRTERMKSVWARAGTKRLG